MKLFAIPLVALALTGCASTDYAAYAEAQASIASAKAEADKVRYQALAHIAQTGGDAAKVAAVMSLQFGAPQAPSAVAAPRPAGDTMLQWASILVPAATQAYAIGKNASVQIEAGRNAAFTAQSTNSAFVGVAGLIQAPGSVTTTNTDSTHAPTVVTQPAPVLVQQPAPLVVNPVVVDPVVVTQPAPVIVQPVP
jgi:hypothetical protein